MLSPAPPAERDSDKRVCLLPPSLRCRAVASVRAARLGEERTVKLDKFNFKKKRLDINESEFKKFNIRTFSQRPFLGRHFEQTMRPNQRPWNQIMMRHKECHEFYGIKLDTTSLRFIKKCRSFCTKLESI